MTRTAILIPARHASSRYPGKPLALLRDASGAARPLVQRSWEAACLAAAQVGSQLGGDTRVYVATDDARIAAVAEGFGAAVILTSPDCENGTVRCAEALGKAGLEVDLVINLQGDSPLTPPWFVTALVERMVADPGIEVATPVLRCDAETYAHFVADRRAGRVGGTTAVFDARGRALYFSKEVLPYIDPRRQDTAWRSVFHHVGLYGYRPEALKKFADCAPGPLEGLEGLEQLRFLENGIAVCCVEVESRGRVFWELNNPEDVPRIESILLRG